MNSDQLSELKRAAIINTLRSCRLFAGLPASDLKNIAAIAILKPLRKGDYLFREGEPSRGFYIVQQGTINVHRVGAGGKEQVIHVFRAGESFAEATLATETGYPADARALESSQVLLMQKLDILALLRRQPELAQLTGIARRAINGHAMRTTRFWISTSSAMPPRASASMRAICSSSKAWRSAVACTSTKRPAPVITTFMSTAACESSS